MANRTRLTITISGEGREQIKDRFEYEDGGCIWHLSDHEDDWIYCPYEFGDGIKELPDMLVIEGEGKHFAPSAQFDQISREYPALTFILKCCETTSELNECWEFKNGVANLKWCWDVDDRNEQRIYVEDGVQLLPLPKWVGVTAEPREIAQIEVAKSLNNAANGGQEVGNG